MRRCALFLLIALALALLAVGAQAQERGDAAGEPPAAPRISRLSWSGLTIRAEWNPVARATGYDLRWTPEEQRRRHLTVSAERAVDGSPAEFSVPWAGRWRVEVRARIGSGPSAVRGAWSRPRILRVYDAPPRLEVERFDGEYARLNWTGVGASYELEWGERGKAKQFARRDGRSPTLELGPLEGGKTYEFRVRARDGAGRSGYSPTAVFTPTGWRGGRPGAGYVGRIGQIYALWFPQRGAEWYELSWINAADPTETARVRVGTATSGGSRPQVPGQIGREGGFENGTWNVRVRAGPRGVWSPLYPLTLSNQPERLALELESSRELCTAGTLTEIMWKISGGSAPYALSVENSAVDVSADNVRINCDALSEAEAADEDASLAAKRVTAVVTDARGVRREAAIDVARARALPAPMVMGGNVSRDAVVFSWWPDKGSIGSGFLMRWRRNDTATWSYRMITHRWSDAQVFASIENLLPGREYLTAFTTLRHSLDASAPEALNWTANRPITPLVQPTGIVTTTTHDTVTVTWERQPSADLYYVHLTGSSGQSTKVRGAAIVRVDEAASGRHKVVFRRVLPNQTYTVTVRVDGRDSEAIELSAATTVRTAPAPTDWTPPLRGPQNLTATATRNTVTLVWEPPYPDAEPRYAITLYHPERPDGWVYYVDDGSTTAMLTDLEPNTTYRIVVSHSGIISTAQEIRATTSPAQVHEANRQDQQVPPHEIPIYGAPWVRPLFGWPFRFSEPLRMTTDAWVWRSDSKKFHVGLDLSPTRPNPQEVSGDGTVLASASGVLRAYRLDDDNTYKYVVYCPERGKTLANQFHVSSAKWTYSPTGATTLLRCGWVASSAHGNVVLIFHETSERYFVTMYGHLDEFDESVTSLFDSNGDDEPNKIESRDLRVSQGAPIAQEGNTGRFSYGDHLHFEIRTFIGTDDEVSEHWYTLEEGFVTGCAELKDLHGNTVNTDYCAMGEIERRMRTVIDPETVLPPPPVALTPTHATGRSADTTVRRFTISDSDVIADSSGVTHDLTVDVIVAFWRPSFYHNITQDSDWMQPANGEGQPRILIAGVAGTTPGVSEYGVVTNCEMTKQPTRLSPSANDGWWIPQWRGTLRLKFGASCNLVAATGNTTFGVARTIPEGLYGREANGEPVELNIQQLHIKRLPRLLPGRHETSGSLTDFEFHFYEFLAISGEEHVFSTILEDRGDVNDVVLEVWGPGGIARRTNGTLVTTRDADAGEVTLRWTPVAAGGVHFLVVRGGHKASTPPPEGTYTVRTVIPAARCAPILGAEGTQDASGATAAATTVCTPATPTGLSVTKVSDSKAMLHWNKATGADGYEVQLDGADVETTLGKNATSYEFTLPSADTAYKLGVAAKRGDQLSAFATLTLLKPPSSITRSTTAHNSVKYTWTDGNSTGSATGAEVKIGATGTRQTADSTEHHTFNNLSASEEYTFYFRLKNDQGPSAWRTATVTTPAQPRLPKPSGLSVTGVGENSLTLNWSAVADAGGYKVKRTGSSSTWTLPSTSRSFTFTGLTSNFRYTLYVQALPKTGSSKVASAWAHEPGRTDSAEPPPTPQPPTPSLTTCLSSARLEAYANWFTDDSHCRSVRASALWSALRSAGIEVGCISRLILGSGEDPMWERYQAAGSRTNFLLRSYDILWLSRSACPTGSGVSGSSDAGALNCAEAVKPETGPAVVSVGGAACVIVRGGGAVQVSDGERTLNLTLSNGRDWVLFAASEFTGSSAGAFWVYDISTGAWIALYPPDGFELERHAPADATALPALLDAIAASAAPSVYPAPDR